MFLRPRRFGKTLWTAILEAYYDVRYAPEFDAIFAGTVAHSRHTPERGTYHTLSLDFSVIDPEHAERCFSSYILNKLDDFRLRYQFDDLDLGGGGFSEQFSNLLTYVSRRGLNLYLIIDEYDNFANKLFLMDEKRYIELVKEKNAFFKQFFTVLKSGTRGNDAPVKRMFITGVTPMTMYDVTSGFNIGENISLNPDFNAMTGITSDELDEMLEYYELDFSGGERRLLEEWYDNYRFSEDADETVFNTDMILYYVKHVIRQGKPPKELIDINVRSDYRKLSYLIYTDGKLNGNFDLTRSLIGGDSFSMDAISQDFSAFDLSKPENFKSLLFYQGLTTIHSSGIDISLRIPNETIKRIDIDYLSCALEMEDVFTPVTDRIKSLLKEFALHGDAEVFEYLAEELKNATGIRDHIYNEACVKSMMLAYLSITPYYVVKSEKELNKGFADIFLKPLNPYVEHVGLLELKYFPRAAKVKRGGKPTKAEIDAKFAEAAEQLDRYAEDPEITIWITEKGKKLAKIAMVFHGWELLELRKF
jgi:hypothetical protein